MRDNDRPILEKITSIRYVKKRCVFYKDRIEVFKRGKMLCCIHFSDIYSMQYRSAFSWRSVWRAWPIRSWKVIVDPEYMWVIFNSSVCGQLMKKWCFRQTIFYNKYDEEIRCRSLILKLTKEEVEILRQHFIVEIEMLK